MNEQQTMLADMVDRLFGEIAASRPEDDGADAGFGARWAQFEAAGLQALLVPEAAGGFGGGGAEAWLVHHAAGRHAIDLPVVEAIVAAGLLANAGLPVPDGRLSIARRVEGGLGEATFTGTLHDVPWGRQADHVVGTSDGRLVCIDVARGDVAQRANAASEPRDDIRIAGASVLSAVHAGPDMMMHGALARAAQIAGAGRSALELAIAHVTERSQFGKPLAKFQAVQHGLATLAEQVSAAEAASRAAHDAGPGLLQTASAKIVANVAAEAAIAIAHQMHGAIGFTWEYALHHRTRRLIAWGGEFGNTRHWSAALGGLAAEQGAEGFWPFLVAGSAAA